VSDTETHPIDEPAPEPAAPEPAAPMPETMPMPAPHETAPTPRPVTETVSEQSPPQSNPPPAPVEAPVAAHAKPDLEDKVKAFFAGWPKTFFHPVHGAVEFEDPNAHAAAGGSTGDFRFETAGEADAARTQTEAEMVVLKRQMGMMQTYEKSHPIIRSSAQAEESAKTGYPEPGLNPVSTSPVPAAAVDDIDSPKPPSDDLI
jgi:hypothetical protein